MKQTDPVRSGKFKVVLWLSRRLPSCAEVSRLASRSLDGKLSWRERLKMRLHVLYCGWCERYLRQLRFLQSAAQAHSRPINSDAAPEMPVETRQRLRQRLRRDIETGDGI